MEKGAIIAPPIKTSATYDFIWVGLIYACLIARNCLYPNEIYDFYLGNKFPGGFNNYMLFLRVYLTRMSNPYKPYNIFRNIVFNIIREGMCFTYPKMFFEYESTGMHNVIDFFSDNAWKVVVLTVIFQYVPLEFHFKIKYLYQYLRCEYFIAFPFWNIYFLNKLHHNDHYRGDILVGLVLCFTQNMDRTGWEMVEDLIFGDMNMFHLG